MTIDNNGNIYLTGTTRNTNSNYDILTIKYNTDGVLQWAVTYDGQNKDDKGNAVAVNSAGDVFVTGNITVSPGGKDIITIKYNASGITQWVKTFNGTGDSTDEAKAIIIDDINNIYITGFTWEYGSSYPYFFCTIKYNQNGDQIWVRHYHGPQYFDNEAYLINLDKAGKVYVAGISEGLTSQRDYLLLKYDSSGNQLWEVRYNGSGNAWDIPRDMIVSDNFNIFITGYSSESDTSDYYGTIKYDSSGILQWVRLFSWDPGQYLGDYAEAITLDSLENVYVTGGSFSTNTNVDFVTVKYNSAGIQQWVRVYNGPINGGDWANDIACDNQGNVYVTGGSPTVNTSWDFYTIKYNSSGGLVWSRRYAAPNSNSFDIAIRIKIDSLNHVYIAGTGNGQGFVNPDLINIKYSQIIGINKISTEISKSHSLSQNYPNPFNPNTVISFQLPVNNFVTLKVYDMLGREISTLINEQLKPGTYEIDWDASGFPSGVYFYKIIANDYSDTKKMILIK